MVLEYMFHPRAGTFITATIGDNQSNQRMLYVNMNMISFPIKATSGPEITELPAWWRYAA